METLDDEDIVISGISGRYPESDNIEELWDNLINHVNMINSDERRWKNDFVINSNFVGKIKDTSAVDSEFFKNKSNLSSEVGCLTWKFLLEATYEAIIDSGRSMENIADTKTAVFLDSGSNTDPEFPRLQFVNGSDVLRVYHLHLAANIVTYVFNLKGEGAIVETACSTGLTALEMAMNDIKMGRADYAIVGSSIISVSPYISLAFESIGSRSSSGRCLAYDQRADGYVRGDGTVVCFLEKAKTAKRVYCNILHCQSNCNGFNNRGIIAPSQEMQRRLYQDVINRMRINPNDVTYVEGHGTGTVLGDMDEISALAEVYCKNRQEPLLVGSIKSNMGHSEITAALCGLTKVILTMERGILPSNFDFRKPNPRIPALVNGQVKVVSENTEWKGGLIALNSFGVGGTNGHAIFRPNSKIRSEVNETKKLKLFAYTTRTKEGLELMLNSLEENPDPYLYGLLSSSMEEPDPHMYWKGYTILNSKKPIRKIKLLKTLDRPVCFVYPGFGCQWSGMGKEIMEIEVCRESLIKSFQYLSVNSSEVAHWICNQDTKEDSFTNRWMKLALVTAIQIALTDLLKILEISPDYIIGHSVGEIVSAYADGCITQEQAMLLSYLQAKVLMEKKTWSWVMVQANLSLKEASMDLPQGVSVVCHNSEKSVIISGQEDTLSPYLKHLTLNNVCFKKIDSFGFPYHSRKLDESCEVLHSEFSRVIPNPKSRSSRWISTSVPNECCDMPKTFSADYLINNISKPVRFFEGLKKVPKNSVFIEISPCCTLKNDIKQTTGMEGKYITFMEKNADNMNVLLSNVGEMYLTGLKPKISRLYPPVNFPVPRGTAMISSLMRWDHSKPQRYLTMQDAINTKHGTIFKIELLRGMFSFMIDHKIKGQVIFPAAGYLFLAWNFFAINNYSKYDRTPAVFEDVQFLKDVALSQSGFEFLQTKYNAKSGKFEIYHNKEVCALGIIRSPKLNVEQTDIDLTDIEISDKITKEDIYKILRLLGYHYGEHFQNITRVNVDGTRGKIKWNNNWITFIDSMMQLPLLSLDSKDLSLLKKIDYLYIDPAKHRKCIAASCSEELLVDFNATSGKIKSGGIIVKGIKRNKIANLDEGETPRLEEYKFIPYFSDRCLADFKELENDLQKYSYVCEAYIKLIMKEVQNFPKNVDQKFHWNNISEPPISLVERFLNNAELKTYLLEQLIFCWESSQPWNEDLTSNLAFREEQDDFLLSAFLNDFVLRTILDVALENTASLIPKVVEIWSSNMWLTKYLHSFFQNLPDREANYTIGYSEIQDWESAILQEENLDITVWDVTSNSLNNMNADIVIGYYTLSKHKSNVISTLSNIRNSLNEGGFAVMIEPKENSIIGYFLYDFQSTSYFQHNQEELVKSFKEANFEIVAQKSDGILLDIYLLRKIPETSPVASVIPIMDDGFEEWIPNIQNSIETQNDSKNIWLVSRNSSCSGIIGLTKCLARELPYGHRIRCLFEITMDNRAQVFGEKEEIPEDILKKDLLINIYQNGQWGCLRHVTIKKDFRIPLPNAVFKLKTPDDFKSFYWCERDVEAKLKSNKMNSFYVYYAGLCYRDVLAKENSEFGFDFAGRDSVGRRIMGITPSSAIATCVSCESKYIWTVPDQWTLAEAATVPLAYTLVYYALIVMGNLTTGETVLIHSGTGAVGQAAINVALSMSCEVFVTVGSEEKRKFLFNNYPALNKEKILKSTDLRFESEILKRTNGKGVDVVLNSMTNEKLIASLRCLAENGRFLNIGICSLNTDSRIAMLLRNKEYIDIKFESLFKNPYYFHEMERNFVNGLKNETVKPINRIIFEKEKVADAFLLMRSNHTGKILIEIRKEEAANQQFEPEICFVPAVPKVIFPCDGTIIMVGAFGGLGMEVTRWLVSRGIRNLVLNSRKGIVNGYQEHYVHMFQRSGINVHISTENLIDKNCAASLVKKANEMGPVIGIFNLAMILEDDLFPKQNPERFRRVTDVKIKISTNLDKISRSLCPFLKYFVMFSSLAVTGSPGQSSYGYGNAAMERICEERREMGFPGLAIQWGLVGDVGYVHETFGSNFQLGKIIPQKISSCLAVLDTLLKQESAVVSSYVVRNKLAKTDKIAVIDFKDILQSCSGIDYNTLDKNSLITDLGIDSMALTELIAALQVNCKITFEIQDLAALTINKIEERIKQSINSC